MGQNLYEVLAMAARYVFAALMLLIVLRALRITVVDARRAKSLRRLSPQTGICGEMVVLEGDERAKRGMRYPVILEGTIGSARRADVRIRHSSVRRRHAYFLLTPDGLSLRAHAAAPLKSQGGRPVKELLLQDGARFFVGRVLLMLVLTQAPEPTTKRPAAPKARDEDMDEFDDAPEGLFDTDRMFREQPVLRYRRIPEDDVRPRRSVNRRQNGAGDGHGARRARARRSSAMDGDLFGRDDGESR